MVSLLAKTYTYHAGHMTRLTTGITAPRDQHAGYPLRIQTNLYHFLCVCVVQ
jgi:hypothetical protein